MRRVWFRPLGWIYRPVSILGWIIVVMAAAFCVHVFVTVDRHSHSASDTLYGIFPYVVPALGVVGWIASRTSERPRD